MAAQLGSEGQQRENYSQRMEKMQDLVLGLG